MSFMLHKTSVIFHLVLISLSVCQWCNRQCIRMSAGKMKKCSVVKMQRKKWYSPQANRKSTQKATTHSNNDPSWILYMLFSKAAAVYYILMTNSRGFQHTSGTTKQTSYSANPRTC